MKPAAFEYRCADSVDEALALLADSDDAKILAGGQSLVPMLNMRLTRAARLVDINALPGERYVEVGRRAVRIGCLARHADFERHRELNARMPLLGRVVRDIAHLAIRNRGTFCGSLCHNDPSAEWPLMAALLDAELLLRRRRGKRVLAAEEFFRGYLTTALEPDEMLVRVTLPVPRGNWGWGFVEFNRRPGDFAIVAAAALLDVRRGKIRSARAALGGVGPHAARLPEVERMIEGEAPDAALWDAAGALAGTLVDPSSDLQATAAFRRHLAERLTRRVLAEAAGRTRSGDEP